jgi:glycosyltransferase involved in cell wall biosynthesis
MMRIGYDLRWRTSTLVHYVENLLRALVVQSKGEFEFVCYGHRTDSQFVAELDGLAEFRQVSWSRYGLDGQVLLPRLLRRDGVKLFHSPFYMMPFFSSVPAFVTIHDVIPFLEYTDKRGLAKMTICALNWLAAHRASAIVTVSELSKKDIVRVLGVPESKIKVAPCAVGSYMATAPKAELYREHVPYFACMTTRHFEAKNTALAIKGWRIFLERTGLPHKLLIGGGTSEEGRARLTELGGAGDCKLLGFVPDENLSSFFHYAEAVIVPSLYEGFGLPALEAMACGAPLLSSNRASLPEVGGNAALYFDAADAEELASLMIRVATDQELRASMISRGKAQAQKFTYAESAQRILSLYRQVLGTAKHRNEGVAAVEVGAESAD